MNYWLKCLYLALSVNVTLAADYQTDILPIFTKHCIECHGPEKQKSDLRLDLRSAAMKGGSEGVVILPGKPEESPLLNYVTLPQDHEKRMPPKGEGLSAEEVQHLREWITGGAPWPEEHAGVDERLKHWSWQPLMKIEAPETEGNPIDYFIRQKLQTQFNKQVEMSPKADRNTLIRRLSFDLHGLPPTPEAVDSFQNDPDLDAYSKLVDKMLASPHYGERYARHWLDIAHYADTHGFERDKRRNTAWRYRDYVIAAFNENKPYDQFLREQIAGDVIHPDSEAATVATGFLAAGPWDFVGQVETPSPELRRASRVLDLDDMTTQVMTSTMAMSVNCARCHDHKLDPISQAEYYRLTAVFAGVKRDERITNVALQKTYEEKKATLAARRSQLTHEVASLEGTGLDLADVVGGGNGYGTGVHGNGIDPRSGAVQTQKSGDLNKVVPNQYTKTKFPYIDGVLVADGGGGKESIPVSSTGITITGIPTTSRKAWDHIRNGPVGSQHSPELGGIDFTKDGHTLLGIHANSGITFDLAAIRKEGGHEAMRFTTNVGYFGAGGGNRADVWIYIDGLSVSAFKHLKREDGLKPIDIPLPETARFLTLLATDGENGYGSDQIGFGDPKLKAESPRELTEADRIKLTKLRAEAQQLDREIATLGPPPKFFGIVASDKMPDVRLMRRGEPEAETGDPLAPGALSLLAGLNPELAPKEAPEGARRRALAEWITHADNPLTARVIVNRLWHWHFGQGIVTTPSDFGLGGDRPSHPELLDWLAGELIRKKWSLREIHRLILTSDTWRQISTYTENHPGVSIDAGNRYLWRQNPRRIEAEVVRDAVLFVSGKLNHQRGGPGFEDFKYTEAYAPVYDYIVADKPELWRRSIYRYIVRTTPDVFMTTLDCPDPANLTPKRMTTTTPLQSLALFNNEFMLKQAGYLADRLTKESGPDLAKQVQKAFFHCFGREPSAEESRFATEFIQTQGLSALCRSLFNANEFVYID